MKGKAPYFSIIIPTYNEEKYLPRLLRSIKDQREKDFEVIVADWKSEDDTRKIARKYGCKIVDVKRKGISAGRNAGAKKARGELLVFLDADVVIPKNFLSRIKKAKGEVITCEWKPLNGKFMERLMYRIGYIICRIYNLTNMRRFGCLPGFCTIIRRELFERIGGYNERLQTGEDHDLAKRALKHAKIMFAPTYVEVDNRRMEKMGKFCLVLDYFVSEVKIRMGKKTKKYMPIR